MRDRRAHLAQMFANCLAEGFQLGALWRGVPAGLQGIAVSRLAAFAALWRNRRRRYPLPPRILKNE
jgi:hypothetical protein